MLASTVSGIPSTSKLLESAPRIPDDQPVGVAPVGIGDEHGELVPAEPSEGPVRRQRPAHSAGDQLDELVAGAVAEGVVDLFEPVEVQQDHGAGALRAGGDGALGDLGETAPVRQPGEGVGDRLALSFDHRLAELFQNAPVFEPDPDMVGE